MAKRKNKSKNKEESALFKFCYEHEEEIHWEQYSEYHYRLFSRHGEIVDVWPISGKYWNARMSKSKVYINIDELLEPLGL